MNYVLYALTNDGESLPIIDVTNPKFAINITEAELAQMSAQFVREEAQRKEITPELRAALGRSIFGQALMQASGSYLPGMITYRMKLGPGLLDADAQAIDRSIAASFPVFTARLRLHDLACMLADGLAKPLNASPRRPVRFINIAGGPGADSWNALIRLRLELPGLLVGREVTVAVLDIDDQGPAFGERAVETLCAPGAPLDELAAGFQYIRYDWAETDPLKNALADLQAEDAVCAISSEGGLFEYGSDAEIVSNLEKLHAGTAPDAIIAGSVTREGGAAASSRTSNLVAARPRTIEAFQTLARQSAWSVERVIVRPFSYHVRLQKGTLER